MPQSAVEHHDRRTHNPFCSAWHFSGCWSQITCWSINNFGSLQSFERSFLRCNKSRRVYVLELQLESFSVNVVHLKCFKDSLSISFSLIGVKVCWEWNTTVNWGNNQISSLKISNIKHWTVWIILVNHLVWIYIVNVLYIK